MTDPSFVRYLPPEPLPKFPGLCWVTRVINVEDPRCPIQVWDVETRMQKREPAAMTFVLNREEFQAMTATRH